MDGNKLTRLEYHRVGQRISATKFERLLFFGVIEFPYKQFGERFSFTELLNRTFQLGLKENPTYIAIDENTNPSEVQALADFISATDDSKNKLLLKALHEARPDLFDSAPSQDP